MPPDGPVRAGALTSRQPHTITLQCPRTHILRENDAMNRNLSINAYFRGLAARHKPKFRFAGSSRQDWQNWRDRLLPAVKATLGRMPEKVPLNPEVQAEWTEDGLTKQRVVFDVEQGLSASAYVFRPADAGGRLPGILACHGHGPFGKESVMGNRGSAEMAEKIARNNYDYGLQMAEAGFAVIAIDWRGFGDRDDRRKPNFIDNYHGRDPCNMMYLRAGLFGMTVLGMDLHDGMCAGLSVRPGVRRCGPDRGDGLELWRDDDDVDEHRRAAHKGLGHHLLQRPVRRLCRP